MSKDIKIGNTTYKVPVNGESKWGERLTQIVLALANAVSNVIGPNDILTKEAVLSNNVSTPSVISGLRFDTSVVQNIRVDGIIVRSYAEASGKSPTQDSFIIAAASYKGDVQYSIEYVGSDAGVNLSLADNGQAYYTSRNEADTESIFIKFYGKSIISSDT